MLAIIEYKTSSTAYVINSVINLSMASLQDLNDTKNMCELKGGYFKVLKYIHL